MQKIVSVESLSKRFGNHLAVDNISFEVERGKVYGLLDRMVVENLLLWGYC